MSRWQCGDGRRRPNKDAEMAARRRKAPAKKEDAEMAARQRRRRPNEEDAEMAARRRRRRTNEEDELVQFMEHHFDEGMKEVLVYSRTNTESPSPRRPRESSEKVEVDLKGIHSRLTLGTESPLRSVYTRFVSRGSGPEFSSSCF